MIEISNPLKLYGQDIVRDIVSTPYFLEDVRSTPPTYREGHAEFLRKRHNNSIGETTLMPYETFFEMWVEFDADKRKPLKERAEHNVTDDTDIEKETLGTFDFDIDTYDRTPYRRTLDGGAVISNGAKIVDRTYIYTYIDNLYYRLCRTAFGEYDSAHRLQRNINTGEDSEPGDIEYASDQASLFDREVISTQQRKELIIDMLFHMKRLFRFGALHGVNYLTFMSAYARALRKQKRDREYARINKKSSTYELTSPRVISMGYYSTDKYGNALSEFTETQKNPRCAVAFQWYTKQTNDYPSYHADVDAIIKDAKALHVELADEDMTKYNKDFFDSITIPMITPDTQYLLPIVSQLKNNAPARSAISTTNLVQHVIRNFETELQYNEELQKLQHNFNLPDYVATNKQRLSSTIKTWYEWTKTDTRLPMDKMKLSSGYVTIDGTPALFDITNWFIEERRETKALLTDFGIFIPIVESGLWYIDHQSFRIILSATTHGGRAYVTDSEWKAWKKVT